MKIVNTREWKDLGSRGCCFLRFGRFFHGAGITGAREPDNP